MCTFHSDLCGSFPSYENSNINVVTDTGQAVKVVENGIKVFLIVIYCNILKCTYNFNQ